MYYITHYLPEIVCIAGLLMYCCLKNAKATTVGLHMFWVGLLCALVTWGEVVKL